MICDASGSLVDIGFARLEELARAVTCLSGAGKVEKFGGHASGMKMPEEIASRDCDVAFLS